MGQHKRSKSGSTPYHSATEDDDDDEGCTHTRNYCKVSNLKNKLPHAKPHCGVSSTLPTPGGLPTTTGLQSPTLAEPVTSHTVVYVPPPLRRAAHPGAVEGVLPGRAEKSQAVGLGGVDRIRPRWRCARSGRFVTSRPTQTPSCKTNFAASWSVVLGIFAA